MDAQHVVHHIMQLRLKKHGCAFRTEHLQVQQVMVVTSGCALKPVDGTTEELAHLIILYCNAQKSKHSRGAVLIDRHANIGSWEPAQS